WVTGSRFEAAILEWRDPPEGAARARFGSGGRLLNIARISDARLNGDFLAEDATASAAGSEASQARFAAIVPVIPIASLAVSLVASVRMESVADLHHHHCDKWVTLRIYSAVPRELGWRAGGFAS